MRVNLYGLSLDGVESARYCGADLTGHNAFTT